MPMNSLAPIALSALVVAMSSPGLTATTTDLFAGFTMDFVDIRGGSNADDTAYGAVAYDYRMSTHEVSGAMIDAYNANSGGPAITRSLAWTASEPAANVSWNEAARFVNWLNVSSGYSPAYKFDSGSILGNDNIALWVPGDVGYDASNPFRNGRAVYVLPSEDEWYRAAYFDPAAGVYWDYATGSDSAPTPVSGGTAAGTAVYDGQPWADITDAGGLSPFGTMGQNGNVEEWIESSFTAPNDSPDELRVYRGGSWWTGDSVNLLSALRSGGSPSVGSNTIGFRVASVPEPSGMLLILVGGLCRVLRRSRA